VIHSSRKFPSADTTAPGAPALGPLSIGVQAIEGGEQTFSRKIVGGSCSLARLTQLPPPLPPPPPPPPPQTSSAENSTTQKLESSKFENSTAARLGCRVQDGDPDGWLSQSNRDESWKKWRARQSDQDFELSDLRRRQPSEA
jgi:hypothetical protein